MSIKQTYTRLSQITSFLLQHPEYIEGNFSTIETSFTRSLYAVLEVAFDISLNPDDLKQIVDQSRGNPDGLTLAGFVASTLENEKTYQLMNRFFITFISAFFNSMKPEYRNVVLSEMEKKGLDEKVLEKSYSTSTPSSF